jgi:hypothetical protein
VHAFDTVIDPLTHDITFKFFLPFKFIERLNIDFQVYCDTRESIQQCDEGAGERDPDCDYCGGFGAGAGSG